MDSFVKQSSFSCEMKIIRAKNVQPVKSTQQLFVTCYLSSTTHNKIRLKTQEISTKSDLLWNKCFSLDCLGNQESVTTMLMNGSVGLELRSRNTGTLLGKIGSSKLLGIAEIPWKRVVESPNMEIVEWAVIKAPMINSKYSSRVMNDEDVNPTAVEIEMKVRVPKMADRTVARKRRWDGECRCIDCASSNNTSFDFEFFTLGAAL